MLKNTLDWISRPHTKDEPSLVAYRGKVVALGAASPGVLGCFPMIYVGDYRNISFFCHMRSCLIFFLWRMDGL